MNRLSMSRLGLAAKCLYGFREDVPTLERPPGKAALVGRLVHSLAEARVTGLSMSTDVDLTLLAEAKAIFDGPLTGFLDSRKWTICEAGYRYDTHTDTCADGPRRGEPGYDDADAHELRGTLDLGIVDGCTGVVIDIKTGKPPTDSEQLYGQAVAFSRRFKLTDVTVSYARALKTKLDILSEEVLDADRLDAEAGKIARHLHLLPTSEPNPGEWCWKCDARPYCPAQPRDEYVPPAAPESALYDDAARLF